MLALVALHGVLGFGIVAFGARLARRALLIGVVGPLTTLVWLATQARTVFDGGSVDQTTEWVPGLGLAFDFRLDGFSALMVLMVSGIGVLVFAYAWWYFPAVKAGLGRLIGLLTLFSGAMVGLVTADNLLLIYLFWELTSVASYFLIGNAWTSARARAAALHALLVTGAGALAMLAGFTVLGQAAGTYELSSILADPPSGSWVAAALVLILLGAFTKSAQYPFHSWLPGAMVAPTPVSAYLHSATMVKAGVYLVARLAPVFVLVQGFRSTIVVVGLVTMVCGGLRALRQHDLKLLLAFGTISQLGFLMVIMGTGTEEAITAGCVLLLAHAAFKCALFMVVGVIDHEVGTRDIRELDGFSPGWRPVTVVAVISAASMAGIPLTLGFIAKEAAYESITIGPFDHSVVVLITVMAASALTFAYSARFVIGAFFTPAKRIRVDASLSTRMSNTPATGFWAPSALLAVATVVLGIFPELVQPLIDAAVGSLGPVSAPFHAEHLALWHGFNLPLLESAVTIAAGVALVVADRQVQRVLILGRPIPTGGDAYRGCLRGLNTLADRSTGFFQSGSLPLYAGIILTTAAVLTGWELVDVAWPGWPDWVGPWAQVPLVALLIGAAVAAAAVRRRFSAALLLGVSGYTMAGLFVIQGAPDLALTQVSIETLSTVLFVLVLRRLPDRFEHRTPALGRVLRVVVSGLVASMVFVFAIVAAGTPHRPSVSGEMIEQAVPEADGKNVVNVILVDFRAFDTLGEITVLAVAAIGAVALARAGRRPQPQPARGSLREQRRARVVPDVWVRLIFQIVLVGSIYFLLAGHNQPGGGFVGGLVAGAAIGLLYVTTGIEGVRQVTRIKPWNILGAGLLISSVTAAIPLAFGRSVLDSGATEITAPVFGSIKITTALPFDLGVYLLVIGLVLMVFEAFGDESGDEIVAPADPQTEGPLVGQASPIGTGPALIDAEEHAAIESESDVSDESDESETVVGAGEVAR